MDNDHSDHDSDDEFPGHKVSNEAYSIMVENHKDNIFQRNEEQEAIRLKKSRKLNQAEDKEDLDQLHSYVHAGILQQMGLEDKDPIVVNNEQRNDGENQQQM
eukprot:10265737-Heterocapsa_arctica.AAC.1